MQPYYSDSTVTLYHGDCLDVLRTLPDSAVDSVVTDPPYELSFMGRAWDCSGIAYRVELWAECLRVLKPGGHLLAFGGTRTYHRLTCAIDDAGFEIRDSVTWLYGSGFPKSLNVASAVDKLRADDTRADLLPGEARFCAWMRDHSGLTSEDARRLLGSARFVTGVVEVVNTGTADSPRMGRRAMVPTAAAWGRLRPHLAAEPPDWVEDLVKAPPSPQSLADWSSGKGRGTAGENEWQGWGTALKPASEPIVVARKPPVGTVAQNVLAHGTGAINIDACRVGAGGQLRGERPRVMGYHGGSDAGPVAALAADQGRWPSNVVLTHAATPDVGDACAHGCVGGCPVAELDAQSGTTVSGSRKAGTYGLMGYMGADAAPMPEITGDAGGASRFFPTFRYEAKADTSERPKVSAVAHPTVKPLALMRWLVRLVTPPGGIVLEPFAGSGTTVEACLRESFRCVAVEREADYLPLIDERIRRALRPWQPHADEVTTGDAEWTLFGGDVA